MWTLLKMIKPMDIIFIGGLCGAMSTLLVLYGTWRHNKQSSEKSTRIETGINKANEEVNNLRKQNDSLKADLGTQLNKIDELRKENTDLYTKLANSSHEIYNNLTGGDGNKPILVMSFTPVIESKDKRIPNYYMIQFAVKNDGKYPLKNVILRISDFAGRDMIPYGVKHWVNGMEMGFGVINKEEEYKNFEFMKKFQVGTISPNTNHVVYKTTYSPDVTALPPHYSVELIWDNGHFIHFANLKVNKGKLVLDHWEALFNGKKTTDMSSIKFE